MSALLVLAAAVSAPEAAPPPPADQLTALLASADEIDAVVAGEHGVAFTIEVGDEAFRVEAATRDGRITGVEELDLGPATSKKHAFSWLADELTESPASIATLQVDGGVVTLETDDGAVYRLIGSRDPNAAVSARWAAAWDHEG